MLKIQKYKNIVRIYNYVVHQEYNISEIFLIMELAKKTLEDRINSKIEKKTTFNSMQLLKLIKVTSDTLDDLQ